MVCQNTLYREVQTASLNKLDHKISLYDEQLDLTAGEIQQTLDRPLKPNVRRHFLALGAGSYATGGLSLRYQPESAHAKATLHGEYAS